MKKIMTLLVAFILPLTIVRAACDYTAQLDLNSKAANVKYNYELKTETKEYDDGVSEEDYFIITFLNITEDLYVEVSNNITSEVKTIRYNDTKDGEASFEWREIYDITNFTIKIYAESTTECSGDLLKTAKLSTPRFNNYYNRAICSDYPDFYLCQKYVTTNQIDESGFINKVESYINGKVDDKGNDIKQEDKKFNFKEFIKYNVKYIIGGVVVIGVAGGVAIYLKKTKKQRDLGI